MIQDIEELGSKLHAPCFPKPVQRRVLGEREIPVDDPRADNCIAAGVAQAIRGGHIYVHYGTYGAYVAIRDDACPGCRTGRGYRKRPAGRRNRKSRRQIGG